jgi:hypothetical protein
LPESQVVRADAGEIAFLVLAARADEPARHSRRILAGRRQYRSRAHPGEILRIGMFAQRQMHIGQLHRLSTGGHSEQLLQQLGGTGGTLARNPELVAATADFHPHALLHQAQVLLQRATQGHQARVVFRLQFEFHRLRQHGFATLLHARSS